MELKNISFKGTFRDYQTRVLNNANIFLADGKINIVAAPGSGKTILGLELIRQQGNPALVLSPTTTIRNQWGERFSEWFSDSNLVSFSILKPKTIISITYQALYSIMNKMSLDEDGNIENYENTDIFKVIKDNKIKTICLDEAHHLQNEWQKTLEKFIDLIENEVKIISLTATPPYDASTSEWERYINVCGEIDDEIFVPQLVDEKSLCPHQDYIYFNYPQKDEIETLEKYRNKAFMALDMIASLASFEDLSEELLDDHFVDEEYFYKNVKQFSSLFSYFASVGAKYNRKHVKMISGTANLPHFNLEKGEVALEFLLKSEVIGNELLKNEIKEILKEHDLLFKGKVALDGNEKIQRQLISSTGKLESIIQITQCESDDLADKLRLLILTDHIKKESISDIGTSNVLSSINVVSIFESIRRADITNDIAILSGGLVVIHQSVVAKLEILAKANKIQFSTKNINETGFVEIAFRSDNKWKVNLVGQLFEQGAIKVLIGTKALLGEGWDSPCINSLILASFIGSFVLSNQMRGRAIRINKNDPDKVANIWHLVTVEPEHIFEKNIAKKIDLKLFYDQERFISRDFDVLKRRFTSFVGPDYDGNTIENGIERITIINPPFNPEGFSQINKKMIKLAKNRANLKSIWDKCLSASTNLVAVNEVEKEKLVVPFTFVSIIPVMILSSVQIAFIVTFFRALTLKPDVLVLIIFILAFLVLGYAWKKAVGKLLIVLSPKRSIQCIALAVFNTLKDMNVIKTNSRVKTNSDRNDVYIQTTLVNATVFEQNIFNTAMTELLSPIDNPRYLIICDKNELIQYRFSYACPEIIGTKKENVEILAQHLNLLLGKTKLIYTRNENGRKVLLKCRNSSYITINARHLRIKKKSTKWD